jgi:hypothetical protein
VQVRAAAVVAVAGERLNPYWRPLAGRVDNAVTELRRLAVVGHPQIERCRRAVAGIQSPNPPWFGAEFTTPGHDQSQGHSGNRR